MEEIQDSKRMEFHHFRDLFLSTTLTSPLKRNRPVGVGHWIGSLWMLVLGSAIIYSESTGFLELCSNLAR